MNDAILVYLHGFNSSGNSNTSTQLRLQLQNEVVSPSYRFVNALLAEKDIEDVVRWAQNRTENVIVIGTSLGGFWANYFSEKYSLKSLLINPVVDPYGSINKYIGQQKNFGTGEDYEFTQEDWESYKNYVSANTFEQKNIFLSINDEVLDYRIAQDFFKNRNTIIDDIGGHRISDIPRLVATLQQFFPNQIKLK
ncbi:MAG: hypothetical protein DI598_12755 [Pseudopedobacter saltans]|uniref:Esterase n=1 Tax=Pseudopedobacter saltans TaxID=151895 RepID=A0A2W5GRJ5_9SPHI|nr:MAG: hypothetical protein DI598_12755 [Pseudopedobacter saltans]